MGKKQTPLGLFTHWSAFFQSTLDLWIFETVNVLCEAETEVLQYKWARQTLLLVRKENITSKFLKLGLSTSSC